MKKLNTLIILLIASGLFFSCEKTPPISECDGGVFTFKFDGKKLEADKLSIYYDPAADITSIYVSYNSILNQGMLPDDAFHLVLTIPAVPFTNGTYQFEGDAQIDFWGKPNGENIFSYSSSNNTGTLKTKLENNAWKIEFNANIQDMIDSSTHDVKSVSFVLEKYNVNENSPRMNVSEVIQGEYTLNMMQRLSVEDPNGDFFEYYDAYSIGLKGKVICSNFDYWLMDPFIDFPQPGVWGTLSFESGWKDDAQTQWFNQISPQGSQYVETSTRSYLYIDLGTSTYYYQNYFQSGKYIKLVFEDKAGNSSLPITVAFY